MAAVAPYYEPKSETMELKTTEQSFVAMDDNDEYADNDDAQENINGLTAQDLQKKITPTARHKLNEEAVREFIKTNISQRKCSTIIRSVQKNDKDPVYCQCGLEINQHYLSEGPLPNGESRMKSLSDETSPVYGTTLQNQQTKLQTIDNRMTSVSETPVYAGEKTFENLQNKLQTVEYRMKSVSETLPVYGKENALPNQQIKWDPECHSVTTSANSYGTIYFDGFGQEASRKAPYIRLDHTTPSETICQLLEKQWNLAPPKLIVSVTGGAKRLNMKPRLLSTFKRGLINTVTAADAWIVTGGMRTGVMEIVGDTILDYMLQTGGTEKRITALGIASWGFVGNRSALVSPDITKPRVHWFNEGHTIFRVFWLFLDGIADYKKESVPNISVATHLKPNPEQVKSGFHFHRSAPFGNVASDEAGNGLFPAKYKTKDLNSGAIPLDPMHTHFILVDNGSENKPGVEINLRVELEAFIAEKYDAQLVLLVLEGGIQTLKTTAGAISKGTPVVVIKGSGRAADFIAYAFYKHKGYEKKLSREDLEKTFYSELSVKADKSFDWGKDVNPKKKAEMIEGCIADVKMIMEHKKLLMVFHLEDNNTTNEIDQAILKVLLSADDNTQSQVELALAWNCIEVARQDIFSMEARLSWQKVDLGSVMQKALIENKVEFVQLFLDSGVKLNKFLTVGRLEDIYQGVLDEIHSDSAVEVFRNLVQESQRSMYSLFYRAIITSNANEVPPITMKVVGEVLDSLTDFERNIYEDFEEVSEMTENLPVEERQRQPSMFPRMTTNNSKNENEQATATDITDGDVGFNTAIELDDFETRKQLAEEERRNKHVLNPERELFVWALLFGRKDLAMLFWRMGRDHIGGALIASRLWKKLAGVADTEEELDLGQELEDKSREFEEIAIGVLNQCYQRDKYLAQILLTRQLDLWGNKTLFTIADDAEQMDFMEHSCCQTQLNKGWTGTMAVNTPLWKILLGLFFITIPFIKFTKNKELSVIKKHDDPDSDPNRAPNSVNYCDVSLFGGGQTISFPSAVYNFVTAPQIKFCSFTIAAMSHLALFSYVIIMQLYPRDDPAKPTSMGIHRTEILLWVWTGSMFLEEVRQVINDESPTILTKILSYFDSLWNVFDMCIFWLFAVAIILRFVLSTDNFSWARMAYSLDLTMFFVRFLQVFFVEQTMGPKVIIIQGMTRDLAMFMVFLVIFFVNYGVVSRALMYPNIAPTSALILQPYFMIFGSMDTGEVQGNFECNDTAYAIDPTTSQPCPRKTWLMVVLLCLQLLVMSIMMINLLIAMFSYTFSNIQDNSEKVWRYYRYSLIYEYFDKPALPPPLILIAQFWGLVNYIVEHAFGQKRDHEPSHFFRRVLTFEENKKLTAFERTSMEEYMLRRQKKMQEHLDYKVSSTSGRIETVINNLEQLTENLEAARPSGSNPNTHVTPSIAGSVTSFRDNTSSGQISDEFNALRDRFARLEESSAQVLNLLRSQSQR